MCLRALFPKSATTLGLVEQTFWRVPLITERIGASSFEVILGKAIETFLSLGLFPLGLLVLDAFLSVCCMKEFGDGFGCVIFPRLLISCRKLPIVSFHTLPVGFPLPTISKNSLYTLFCPLILDNGVSFMISISGPKVPISYILIDTSFHHRFQYVIIKSYVLLMNLQVIQFQYGLKFLRLSYSYFAQSFQDIIKWDFR